MISLVFDTETTGIPRHPNAKDKVQPSMIEFGGALVDETGEIVDEINLLIKPREVNPAKGKKLGFHELLNWEGIQRITGLTEEEFDDAPSFAEAVEQIRPFFARANRLIAHNLPFDKTILELDLARTGVTDWPWPSVQICTVQEHAEAWGRRPKLIELYHHYTGEPLAQTHRALDDVHALITVCKLAGTLK